MLSYLGADSVELIVMDGASVSATSCSDGTPFCGAASGMLAQGQKLAAIRLSSTSATPANEDAAVRFLISQRLQNGLDLTHTDACQRSAGDRERSDRRA